MADITTFIIRCLFVIRYRITDIRACDVFEALGTIVFYIGLAWLSMYSVKGSLKRFRQRIREKREDNFCLPLIKPSDYVELIEVTT